MADSLIPITAAEILKLAFNEFIKSSAGETARRLTGEALIKANELRHKILAWFKDRKNAKAEKAFFTVQEQGSPEALNKLITYLDDEMEVEPAFAQGLRQIAQQIVNIQNMNQEQVHFGELKQENRENAKGYQIQAKQINRIGDTYNK